MSHQSELQLENNLIKQLIGLKYSSVKIMVTKTKSLPIGNVILILLTHQEQTKHSKTELMDVILAR